ncbi:MAG: sulfatase-like hydrolase/transferase [Chloroflexi bacterium]|nr:sulfatase-like hydrolase/transferase [Chloroflexota bacterium]
MNYRTGLVSAFLFLAACTTPIPTASPPPTSAAPTLAAPVPNTAPTLAASPTPSRAKPNIVFILTDDLDAAEIAFMPKLKTLLTDQGVSFSNFFVNVSLCCPSRATILRGQYAHNTGVYGNTPPDGGFEKFVSSGDEKSTVATWLQSAGYKTMLAGKYLNGYPVRSNQTYIPPGWDEWYSAAKGDAYGEFNYTLNENGKFVQYGNKAEDYGTDVYTRKAVDFIQRAARENKPFFIYLGYYAPHSPATSAPRHEKMFADAKAPRPPSYNEADVSDKPNYIKGLATLSAREQTRLDEDYRNRLRSLQAVDDAIETLVNALKQNGQLENTFIVFTSDNGYHMGQHRLQQGKQTAYEEDIHVPLIMRGPNIPAGKTLDAIAGNVDFAPTFAEIGGAKIPDFVDGRSLVSLWGNQPLADWRQVYLLMHGNPNAQPPRAAPRGTPTAPSGVNEPDDAQTAQVQGKTATGIPAFAGLRTHEYTYVEYTTGEKELYDLKADPYELQNLAAKADANLLKILAARLAELRKCAGEKCRVIENQILK